GHAAQGEQQHLRHERRADRRRGGRPDAQVHRGRVPGRRHHQDAARKAVRRAQGPQGRAVGRGDQRQAV
ncbi:hypothetical protein LPJ53_006460, partial [Coemansia erecta]